MFRFSCLPRAFSHRDLHSLLTASTISPRFKCFPQIHSPRALQSLSLRCHHSPRVLQSPSCHLHYLLHQLPRKRHKFVCLQFPSSPSKTWMMHLCLLPLLIDVGVQRHPQHNSRCSFKKTNLVNAMHAMLPSTGVSLTMPLALTPAPNKNEPVATI